jgi:peptidyl-tRNA hydrolase ICT1
LFSLKSLYPGSEEKVEKGGFSGEFSGVIPVKELTATYSCSSGPGGQNVNKVSTKVDLR